MRLFVAVDLPEDVAELVRGLERRPFRELRWTTEAQWHITLRFLGEVDAEQVPALCDALDTVPTVLADDVVVEAVLGPVSGWFPGRHVLQVPVGGLDELAEAVAEASSGWGQPPERHFRGHLTLARTRGGQGGSPGLAGTALSATWPVEEVVLYSSSLGEGGSRYEALHRVAIPA